MQRPLPAAAQRLEEDFERFPLRRQPRARCRNLPREKRNESHHEWRRPPVWRRDSFEFVRGDQNPTMNTCKLTSYHSVKSVSAKHPSYSSEDAASRRIGERIARSALSRHVSRVGHRGHPRCPRNAIHRRAAATWPHAGTRLTAVRPRVQFWASPPGKPIQTLSSVPEEDVHITAGNKFRSIDTCQQQFCAILPRFLLNFYPPYVIKIQVSFGFF